MVSIIIPVYNTVTYIKQCIQSVICQTYKELEVIIIDDCSTDDSLKIVENIVNDYSGTIQFRLLRHEKNRGLGEGRTTGMKAAKGQWIFFLDSDDWICPDCIESLVKRAEQYPDVQIIFAGAESNDDKYSFMDYTRKKLPEYSSNRTWLQESMLRRYDFGMTMWGKLVSTDFIRGFALYSMPIVHEDEEWNFRAAKHICSAGFVSRNLYFYRVEGESIINGCPLEKKIDRLIVLWNVLISEIGGFNKKAQVWAIYKYIYDETRVWFPREKKNLSCWLYVKLAVRSHNAFSIRLLMQSARGLW